MAHPRPLTPVSYGLGFVLRALAWSLALFGLLRTGWVEQSLVLALLHIQGTIVRWYVSAAASAIVITPGCSAADVMAVCLGVILGFPAPWRRRLAGAAGGLVLILAVNVIRIGTLALFVSAWPAAFSIVHLYVWPILLTAVTAAYVWWWMARAQPGGGAATRVAAPSWVRRFAWIGGSLLGLHFLLAPWTETSGLMIAAGAWAASAARIVLTSVGMSAQANGAVLATSRGSFIITPECLLTPVLPLYLGAVLSLPLGRWRRTAALVAALPLFFGTRHPARARARGALRHRPDVAALSGPRVLPESRRPWPSWRSPPRS